MKGAIVAHRGASADAKENTIAAFERAIALQADWVEFDVRQTKDQVLVVYHDAELNHQKIQDLTWQEIQAIDSEIPTLNTVIVCCQNQIRMDIELKVAGCEAQFINELKQLPIDSYAITSFQISVLDRIKQLAPRATTGWLLKEQLNDYTIDQCRDWIETVRVNFVAPHWQLLDSAWLDAIAPTQPYWVWTVNDAISMQRCLAHAQVAAIITDRPDWCRGWRY